MKLTNETLELYRKIAANPVTADSELAKVAGYSQAASATSGLTSYDLDPVS